MVQEVLIMVQEERLQGLTATCLPLISPKYTLLMLHHLSLIQKVLCIFSSRLHLLTHSKLQIADAVAKKFMDKLLCRHFGMYCYIRSNSSYFGVKHSVCISCSSYIGLFCYKISGVTYHRSWKWGARWARAPLEFWAQKH